LAGSGGFDIFIADLFALYNRLTRELPGNRQFVIAASRRAFAVLRAYPPQDDGEAILIEVAIEQFEDLERKAGGR
jgi:hypothetical protein